MFITVQALKRSLIALFALSSASSLQAEIYSSPDLKNGKTYLAGEIDPAEAQGAWVMTYANFAHQDAQDLTAGYRSKTYGGGFGVDVRPIDPLLLGIGLRFDYTDLDSLNYVGTNLNFTGTHLMAYGRYDVNDRWFINALVGYSFNEYNSQRNVLTFPVPGASATIVEVNGDLDGRQLTAEIDSGYQFSYDKWQFMPVASVTFNHLALEDYNEFGLLGTNRQFSKRDFDSLKMALDLVLAYQLEFPLAQLMPYLHFKSIYDTETDLEFTTDVFGGGTAFSSFGARPPHTSFQTGAGFTLFGQGSVQVSMRYDFTYKHHYRDHGGVIYIRHEW